MTTSNIKISDLRVGDKVRIIGHRNPWWNTSGKMDHWMNAIMTIREIGDSFIKMEEDRVWAWGVEDIAEVVDQMTVADDKEPEFVKVSHEEADAEMSIKDSGTRRQFETGAVRDIQEGKGRCDLLPLAEIGFIIDNTDINSILIDINMFMRCGKAVCLLHAVEEFTDRFFPDRETAILELAKHYEEGCLKYGERNWEKGIPIHCYIDSGIRHLIKFSRGDKDERHDRAFMWNMIGAVWTAVNKPELIDIPAQPDSAEANT